MLAPSTLHIFWDLFGQLAKNGVAIYMDSSAYPIARWGVERAAVYGVPVQSFPNHDADALRWQLRQDARRRLRPLVVADGFSPGSGKPAPIAAYLEIVRMYGGQLILDDTQALGIFGHSPSLGAPYGRGGGGMLRWSRIGGPDVLVASSLAKGFGVPVAVLAGSNTVIGHFEGKSETRVHSSPPSIAVIHAANQALALNQLRGDDLRLRLVDLVRYFRNRLKKAGFSTTGGLFPVQTLVPIPMLDARTLHGDLLRLGVGTVLHRSGVGLRGRISFVITARHTPQEIDHAVDALVHAAGMKT
jgi:8-amino-7-oxononanoate synthase